MSIWQKNINKDFLLKGNLVKAVFMLAIPVVINNFLQTMYNLTDTFWLGKLGTFEQAAINLVTPMQNAVINFGSGITTAGAILISQYMGAKQEREAKSVANQIFAC
ncbi:MAG: MATE family efflux transporter, partial [Lachnospiraceae bacterium]|nr:MATE family efflux transporter [Lachnospiraceae bacterium]